MNTFILNGNPKKNGHTGYLLDQLTRHIPGEITHFPLYKEPVSPCIDCGYCRTHKGCSIQDKMQDIYDCIETHDLVIVSSPIFYLNITPPLLSVLTRFQRYFDETFQIIPQGKAKKGIIVLSGGGGGGFEPSEKSALRMLRTMNAEHVATIHSLETDRLAAKDDLEATKQIQAAVEKLALAP